MHWWHFGIIFYDTGNYFLFLPLIECSGLGKNCLQFSNKMEGRHKQKIITESKWKFTGRYLPSLDPDCGHSIMHVNVSNSNICNTSLGIIPAKSTYTYSMPGPTIQAVYIYIRTSRLDRHAIIPYTQNCTYMIYLFNYINMDKSLSRFMVWVWICGIVKK